MAPGRRQTVLAIRGGPVASPPPELATPGDVAARHGSRPASSGKLPRRPGESGITHSQH